jgi:cytoskeletal protein CcmA (bactofilin family)
MKKVIALLFLIVHCLLFLANPVHAESNFVVLNKGTVIESDYLKAGETVLIEGEIKGDAFLAGGVVTVNGAIDGDLFVFGGKVSVNGPVNNNIRIFGGDVTLTGPVGRNVLLIGGNLSVNKSAALGGSLIAAGGNLDLSASRLGRGFRFFGGRLYLNTLVANEAFVVAEREFFLGPAASIAGNLKYTGRSEAVLDPGATVSGEILYEPKIKEADYPGFFSAKKYFDGFSKLRPFLEVISLAVSFIIGFVLLGLFPKIFEKTTMAIETRPYAAFGTGIISFLLIGLVIVLLTVTLVGIPLAVMTFLLSLLLAYVARFLIAFFIGRKIMLSKFGERRGWSIVLGLTVYAFLSFIPVVGELLRWILLTFALGGLVLSYRQPAIYEQQPIPFESVPVTPARHAKRPGRPRSRPRR